MKKSIKELFAVLEGGRPETDAKPAEDAGTKDASPAERLGRALLERLGAEGMDEAELADAIIAVWSEAPKAEPEAGREYAEPAAEVLKPAAKPPLIAEHRSVRAPMRAEAAAEAPMDYGELTPEQFRKLKKQLQRAAADGRRVRI